MLFGVATSIPETVGLEFDGVELRLDLFDKVDFDAIRDFIDRFDRPVLLTWRRHPHPSLFEVKPAFVDLEWDTDQAFVTRMRELHPEVKIICSYHRYEEGVNDFEAILATMFFSDAYKIALYVKSAIDALRLLLFVKEKTRTGLKITGIAMGEAMQFSRELGSYVGNFIDYAPLKEPMAPGQLRTLPRLNAHSNIYGIIGNPLTRVLSPQAHNEAFRKWRLDAHYVKIPLEPDELGPFFPLAKKLAIKGISVTTPLKEAIISHVDILEPDAIAMGAVNTLTLSDGHYLGSNTDGDGALDAIEQRGSVHKKRMVLIGAGGAARAIGYTAQRRGAEVILLNRAPDRACRLAAQLGVRGEGLDRLPEIARGGLRHPRQLHPPPPPDRSCVPPSERTYHGYQGISRNTLPSFTCAPPYRRR